MCTDFPSISRQAFPEHSPKTHFVTLRVFGLDVVRFAYFGMISVLIPACVTVALHDSDAPSARGAPRGPSAFVVFVGCMATAGILAVGGCGVVGAAASPGSIQALWFLLKSFSKPMVLRASLQV